MRNRFLEKLGFLMVFTGMLSGCSQKDLNPDAPSTIAGNVTVVFDWSAAGAYEWSQAPAEAVATMGLYLYSEDHGMMDYWFKDASGGMIRAYAGRHTAVCHSHDDPYIHLVRNQHSHDEIEILTDNTAVLVGQGISTRGIPRAKGTEDEPLRYTPTVIYGSNDRNIHLRATNLAQTLTFTPVELVCHYNVRFENVGNIQNAELRIDATISSLAGGYFPGRMTPSTEAVSHTFTLTADKQMKTLSADFFTFGVPDGEKRPHLICVYVALKNRTGNSYTFDVSDQVNNAPDPRNVDIVLHGLTLPDIPDDPPDTPPSTGMSVEIDSWDTFHYDVKV